MKALLKWLGLGIAAIAVVALGVALGARYADGPLGPFPGGPMSGERVTEPVAEWGFAAERDTVELEVNPDAPRSITTWVLGHEGALYIPAGLASRKTWPGQVMADGRVVLRVAGRLYPRQAVRVTDAARLEALGEVLTRKYQLDPEGNFASAETWFFRLDPPRP